MANKLVQHYNKINQELKHIQDMMAGSADTETIQNRIAELKAERTDLENALYLTAISHIRDEAWRALSYNAS